MNLQERITQATEQCIEISAKLKSLMDNPLSTEEMLAIDQMNNQTIIMMSDIAQASTMTELNQSDIDSIGRLLVLCHSMHESVMAI